MTGAEDPPHSGVRGRLRIGFTADPGGRTRLTEQTHAPPLQVVRAFTHPDGAALVHLHNVSGGVLGGDTLETHIKVGVGAQAQVTTTGATRVYRSRVDDGPACQVTHAQVGQDGLLEYLPDPLIPFAGARYRQETRVTLAPGAGLFWWETVAPGRAAYGEVFAYERLDLHVDLTGDGRLLARERVRLEPAMSPLSSPVRLGPYRYFSTLYLCRVGVPTDEWMSLEARMNEHAAAVSRPGETVWGVSALPAHGLCVRGLSVRGLDLAPRLVTFWRDAKWALYGRHAVLPRKVY